MLTLMLPALRAEAENLGELTLSGLLIEPAFTLDEPKRGHFDIGRSFIAASWIRDEMISAKMKLGSKSLIGQPARYGPGPTDELGLIEAYGQADTSFGMLRAGLVPIQYGLEGGDIEEQLRFPRSFIYSKRIVNLRDHGVSYHIDNKGFFTDFAVHNGEGGPDLDNEIWVTGRWGWQSPRAIRMGFSGTTGGTTPLSTDPDGTSSSTEAGLNVDESSRIRIANAFLSWRFDPFLFETEASGGDVIQDSGVEKIRGIRGDFEYRSSDRFSWLVRYDSYDPSDSPKDREIEYTAGWAWRSKYENSVLYIFGSKVVQENVEQDTHRLQILWRLTPTASGFGTRL
ncbi:MAG TPA: hypothetical protein VM432_07400 [Bdellovibrionales bacterium]|nr:hypothetical protein [Bdellovibrionales bacterium]